MKLRTIPDLSHLTYGECLAIVVKRYQRWERAIERPGRDSEMPLFNTREEVTA
jgi:hypothetical protein